MTKYGKGKPKLGLLPVAGLNWAAQAAEFGNAKYENPKDYHTNTKAEDHLHAALRHIFAELDGETKDAESGAPTIGHAVARLLIYADMVTKKAPSSSCFDCGEDAQGAGLCTPCMNKRMGFGNYEQSKT